MLRQELRDDILEQHAIMMARYNISWTKTDTKNNVAQELDSNLSNTSLPHEDDMVTLPSPLWIFCSSDPFKTLPYPTSIVATITITAVTITTAIHTNTLHVRHGEAFLHPIIEVHLATHLQSHLELAIGYKDLETRTSIGDMLIPFTKGLPNLGDFSHTRVARVCEGPKPNPTR